MSAPKFKDLGFYKEFYIELKPLGYIYCEKDRETVGWNGRKKETLTENIVLHNKKTVKAGTTVTTILYPLCGRMVK